LNISDNIRKNLWTYVVFILVQKKTTSRFWEVC
jgi:hypothetical protein